MGKDIHRRNNQSSTLTLTWHTEVTLVESSKLGGVPVWEINRCSWSE